MTEQPLTSRFAASPPGPALSSAKKPREPGAGAIGRQACPRGWPQRAVARCAADQPDAATIAVDLVVRRGLRSDAAHIGNRFVPDRRGNLFFPERFGSADRRNVAVFPAAGRDVCNRAGKRGVQMLRSGCVQRAPRRAFRPQPGHIPRQPGNRVLLVETNVFFGCAIHPVIKLPVEIGIRPRSGAVQKDTEGNSSRYPHRGHPDLDFLAYAAQGRSGAGLEGASTGNISSVLRGMRGAVLGGQRMPRTEAGFAELGLARARPPDMKLFAGLLRVPGANIAHFVRMQLFPERKHRSQAGGAALRRRSIEIAVRSDKA